MRTIPQRLSARRTTSGQIMVIYGLICPVLFLFMGLGIDSGLMYVTKAKLSRSVDAVALRLARKFTSVQSERENMAMTIMRANYSDFLKGVTGFSSSGTLDGSSGETMTASQDGQSLTINTMSNNATAVVTVKVTAETDHYTFFMPLANVKKAHFVDSATAERFPACNILILDNSGSMTGNGGSTNMGPAVKAFLAEFDEGRDYLLMVSFNYVSWVLWPPPGEGVVNGRIRPARGFLTGAGTSFSKTAGQAADAMSFVNSTNAASGIRLAGYNVDEWYNTLTPLEKSKIKFNYVFMTDGDFNGAPTYVKGFGFGYPDWRYKDASKADKITGTGKGETLDYDNLPDIGKKYHYLKPVYGGDSNEYQVNGSNVVFNWYQTNGTLRGSYDLRSRFMTPVNIDLGTLNPTACIQVNLGQASPGTTNLYMPFPVLSSSEIPAGSGTSNNTVSKFNNYTGDANSGKKWGGGWNATNTVLGYYYPDFDHPKDLVYPTKFSESNTFNEDGVKGNASNNRYWKEWYSFADQNWQSGAIDGGSATSDVPNWTALAQVSYFRKAHNATFYAVGFDAANEEIMRNIANQKSDGTALEAGDNRGKYYKVTNASDLTTTFRDVARQIAVRLSE